MTTITRNCFFCKREFRGEPDETSCDGCKNIIISAINKNGSFKKLVGNALLDDEDFVSSLVHKILYSPISITGLGGAGSIAKFFRKKGKKKAKAKT